MNQIPWLICLALVTLDGVFSKTGIYTFNDVIHRSCLTGSAFFHSDITSAIQCMAICSAHKSCRSAVYIPSRRQCRGCHTTNNLVLELGGMLYENEAEDIRQDCANHRTIGNSHAEAAAAALVHDPDICVRKILSVGNGGRAGAWEDAHFCPMGTLAVGFIIKIESNQGPLDDSGANELSLVCNTADQTVYTETGAITTHPSNHGTWRDPIICEKGDVFVAFRLQVEEFADTYIIPDDNSALNYVRFKCGSLSGGSAVSIGTNGPFGDFGPWSAICDTGNAICGMRARFDDTDGMDVDNTALNDVVFYCC